MPDCRPLAISGLFEITPRKFGDERGFLSETYSADALAATGIDVAFVQDNHSYSAARGVLRGLHFQRPPVAQDKLVRVTRGAVFDVAVDVRQGSPTFGHWVGLTLSAALWNQIFIPKGFAHGFVTLEPDCEVQYKVSAPYSPEHERSIRFDDPAIAIEWPVPSGEVQLSPRDAAGEMLAATDTGFVYP